jgi:hypothetical protein
VPVVSVTGHSNPDTDSIASAIVYAESRWRLDPSPRNDYGDLQVRAVSAGYLCFVAIAVIGRTVDGIAGCACRRQGGLSWLQGSRWTGPREDIVVSVKRRG